MNPNPVSDSVAAVSPLRRRLNALGPGILMASAAIGGSHLVASTQAGALYGWQLAIVIILANLLKYPFFMFGTQYTMKTGKSLVEGYAGQGRVYLWVFWLLAIVSATISTGAVALVSAAIVKMALPALPLGTDALAVGVMALTVIILFAGNYRALDKVTKLIMISLTITTVAATFIAAAKGSQMLPDFVEPSPWNMAAFGFIVALMGWMPAPIEISTINSMWVTAKQKIDPASYKDAMFDFNTGYTVSAVLALFFLALGAFVQYGNGEPLKMAGGAYIGQLIEMYARTIGEWSRLLVAFIAFACMFGTTITVADGYARINAEAMRLILRQSHMTQRMVNIWTAWSVGSGLAIILWFNSAMGEMLKFAMISAFLTAPAFALMNYRLVKSMPEGLSPAIRILSWAGLLYLFGFAIAFVLNLMGILV